MPRVSGVRGEADSYLVEARVEVEVELVSHEDVREVEHTPVRMMRRTTIQTETSNKWKSNIPCEYTRFART